MVEFDDDDFGTIPVEFTSVVNDLRHGNYICKSEGIYLTYEHRIKIPVEFTYVNQ